MISDEHRSKEAKGAFTLDASSKMTVEKLGLTHKEIFTLYVLQQLEKGPEHGMIIYQGMQEELLGKKVSRSHFYATLKEMQALGLIKPASENEKKKWMRITEKGQQKRTWYYETYFAQLSQIKKIADLIVYEVTRAGERPGVIELSHEHQKFFSKLVHVRRLIEYTVLHHLQKQRSFIPADLLELFLPLYGWKPAKMYFYDVLWEMEEKLWISGEWSDSRKRTNRIYHATQEGLHHFLSVEEEVLFYARIVKRFIESVILLLDQPKSEEVRKKSL